MAKLLKANPDNYFRNVKRSLRKKINKLSEKLVTGKGSPAALQATIIEYERQIRVLEAQQKEVNRVRQELAKQKQQQIAKAHKVSGFNRIRASMSSGGLPSLGKKR